MEKNYLSTIVLSRKLITLAGAMLILFALVVAWVEFRSPEAPQGSQTRESAPSQPRNAPIIAAATRPYQNDSSQVGKPTPVNPVSYHIRNEKVLNYGSAEGEIGMIRESGQTPVGPESFTIGNDGSILVADLVNQRVLFYSSNGSFLRSFKLPGIVLNDIAVDAQGNIYVYDHMHRTLSQYDMQGVPQGVLQIKPADIDTRGYFHVVDGSIYFADAATRDILIGTLGNNLLTAADTSLERITEGIHGASGRVYSVDLVKSEAFEVRAQDSTTLQATMQLKIPSPGIVSVTFVGEDANRCFYIQTERLVEDSVVLEVCALNAAGELLAVTKMPENDYALWTTKLLGVTPDGGIVQFLPQGIHAKLNVFTR